MDIAGSIVVLVIAWWISFQALLPFGVRNAAEAGEARPAGQDPGAPQQPQLLRKALWAAICALVIWAALFTFVNYSGVRFSDLWFPFPEPQKPAGL